VELTDVSKMLTASIVRAMSTSTRIHGAIFQKDVVFILAAVRT
jgi:hypothetical protein